MHKSQSKSKLSRKAKAEQLFILTDHEDKKGNLRLAFRFFLAGAKLGEIGCQVNGGNYYDDGKGVLRNRKAAPIGTSAPIGEATRAQQAIYRNFAAKREKAEPCLGLVQEILLHRK